jgi:hypothetical protein
MNAKERGKPNPQKTALTSPDPFAQDPTNSICKKYDIDIMPRTGYAYGVPRPSVLVFDRQLNELYRWTAANRRDLFMPSNRPLPTQVFVSFGCLLHFNVLFVFFF